MNLNDTKETIEVRDSAKTGGGMGSFAKSIIKDVIIAGVLAGTVLCFIRPTIVKQTSMQPTMNENDYIIMYKLAYRGNSEPERGDIIVFQSDLTDQNGEAKLLIKRAIGLPGDVITIKDNQLYINGTAYQEDYLKDGVTSGDIQDLKVPENQYFVMGDNRLVSVDSRSSEVGFVKIEDIKGKAILRLYPFGEIKTF